MSVTIQASFPPTVIVALVQSKCVESRAKTIRLFKGEIKTETTTKTIIAVIAPVMDFFPVM